MRLALLGLVAVAAALAATVEPANACSCALGDPRAALARADGAFVGTLVERRGPTDPRSSLEPVTLVFRVERSVKGELGEKVEVWTVVSGASCGIELEVGRRTGLFLDRSARGWEGSLCGQIAPAKLLEAARPLPAPDGRGAAALLVGGGFGPARTIALDRRGRTLAYGRGEGKTLLLAACPGGRRLAEVALRGRVWLVAVRELRTLRLVRSRPLPVSPGVGASAVGCGDRDGARVHVFVSSIDFPDRARLVRAGPGAVTTVWRGTALTASFAGPVAYVNRGRRGEDVARIDLAGGRATRVARVPAWTGALVPSPDGRLLAGVTYSAPLRASAPPSRLVLVGDNGVRTAPLGGAGVAGDAVWLADGGIVFLPAHEVDVARVYDRMLRLRRTLRPWRARGGVVVGETAWGVGWHGDLVRAELRGGPIRRVRTLPSPAVNALVAVG